MNIVDALREFIACYCDAHEELTMLELIGAVRVVETELIDAAMIGDDEDDSDEGEGEADA